jgi:crotonobetainyl-CoA:carnitine CoA-transferase CaiB-like acyl-CoA transferase
MVAMLEPYRVLDLTDKRGFLCGKILGDLGAEVIKIEKPGGGPDREIPPFFQDDPHPEKSLYWFAFNANKKGITLNIETLDGRSLFKELVKRADFVIDTFFQEYLKTLGLDYPVLRAWNPSIVVASITDFGQTGPYKDYQAPDIVAMGLGGLTYMSGDPDRPPLRIPVDQSCLHAGAWTASACMVALHHRVDGGEGQFIDVSVHEAAQWSSYVAQEHYSLAGRNIKREGMWRDMGPYSQQRIFPCKDGVVTFIVRGGKNAPPGQRYMVEEMIREGMCPDWLKDFDFKKWEDSGTTQEFADAMADAFGAYFKTRTKAELFRIGVEESCFLAPVSDAEELLNNPQLKDRDFWVSIDHPELDAAFTYPGPFLKASEAPVIVQRRAPLIGEHNREIYSQLGFSDEDLVRFKELGVI